MTWTLDLKDFFPSVERRYVYTIFHSLGYDKLISAVLTNICTFGNAIPQGGPCSPKLANLAASRLDMRLQGYLGRRGIGYTRYADDLTFSGRNPGKVVKTLPMIKSIITNERFTVNDDKTRIAGPARARRVTGLVLSGNSFGIGKEKYKLLRAKIHYLIKDGEQKNTRLVREVDGWLAYLKSVDPKRLGDARKYILKLKTSHPNTLIASLKFPI